MKTVSALFGKILLLTLCTFSLSAQTTLGPGDIAFTIFNMDTAPGDDDVGFVLLKDVVANTKITFTDDEFFGSSLNSGEGRLTLTFTSAFSCGDEFFLSQTGSGSWTVQSEFGNSNGLSLAFNSGTVAFSSAGDAVIAFQDANPNTSNPARYIAAILNSGGSFGGSTPTGNIDLPTGLAVGVSAMAFTRTVGGNPVEFDNIKYNCSSTLSGTPEQIAATLNTRANWVGNDNSPYPTTSCGFTCLAACVDPTLTSLSANPSSPCPGAPTTITINGTLNDAAFWVLRSGSCSGTQVATTTGSTFTVSPTAPTTYYVTVQKCDLTSLCQQITISPNGVTADAGPDQLVTSGTTRLLWRVTTLHPAPACGLSLTVPEEASAMPRSSIPLSPASMAWATF